MNPSSVPTEDTARHERLAEAIRQQIDAALSRPLAGNAVKGLITIWTRAGRPPAVCLKS